MRRLIPLVGLVLALFGAPALAATCSTYPYTLTNGQTADANQVMANFNSILNCANVSLQPLLSLPLSTANGGTGNAAGTVAGLTTARTIAITGDLAYTSPSFDGTANVTGAATLATVNASPGTYGAAWAIPQFTVNGKGLVTGVATVTPVPTSASITGAMLAAGAATTNLGFTPVNRAGDTMTGELTLAASGSGTASLNLPQGSAPSSPVNGDIWTTSSGVFARINASTQQLASTSGSVASFNTRTGAVTLTAGDVTGALGFTPLNRAGDTMTGALTLVTGSASVAPLTFQSGTNLTSAVSGVVEYNGTNFFGTDSTPTRHTFAFTDSNITGSAAKWTTARTETLTGNVTGSTGSIDGSGNWSIATTIASAAVTNAMHANLSANTVSCNATGGAAAPTDCSVSTMATLLGGTTSGTLAAGNDSRFVGPTQLSKSINYTFVLGDGGTQIYHPSADTTPRTWTIPANGSVAYAVGAKIELVNDCSAGAITLAITTDTLEWFPAGTTGSRTIAACGTGTITKLTSTEWMLTGVGIS